MSARAVENDVVLPGFAPERECPSAISDSPGSASTSWHQARNVRAS